MVTARQVLLRACIVACLGLGTSACETWGKFGGIIPAGVWQSWVSTLSSRASRIKDLLSNCNGPASAQAAAAAATLDTRTDSLVNTTQGNSDYNPFGVTQNDADGKLQSFFSAQDAALVAAQACGLVQPDIPKGQGWDATWDDISS